MKVIELLNKIANGEVSEKIYYNGTLYSYDVGIDYKDNHGGYLMGDRVCICPEDLNEEVEIIEEHKIPEKLNPEKMSIYEMSLKINEIIDYLRK